jgi:hypothetical protein
VRQRDTKIEYILDLDLDLKFLVNQKGSKNKSKICCDKRYLLREIKAKVVDLTKWKREVH